MKRWLTGCIVVIFALRLVVAYTLPLTGDEAYYWEWAQRPAFGYVDHPPLVAWTIATFAWLGRRPGDIRFGFWLCGVIATFAAADAARRLLLGRAASPAQARRGALQAAFFMTIAPIASLAFVTASPDGPYLAAWALTIDVICMITTQMRQQTRLAPVLGITLAAALMARAFGVALILGTGIALRDKPRILTLAFCTALLLCTPFLGWNAQHHWVTLVFTLAGRHVNEGVSLLRPAVMLIEVIAAFGLLSSPHLSYFAAQSRVAILWWTAVPLAGLFLALAAVERVETYWFLGPYVSLCIMAALTLPMRCGEDTPQPRGLRITMGFSCALTLFVLSLASAPYLIFTVLTKAVHIRLHNSSIFEIYTYEKLARDVRILSDRQRTLVMTDGYGLSSLLDFHSGVKPVVIGYTWQGREALHWMPEGQAQPRILFLDKEALEARPDFQNQLHRACSQVRAGPTFSYALPGIPARVYYSTWCENLGQNGLHILRWEK